MVIMFIMTIFIITIVKIIVMNNHDFATFVPRGETTGPGDDLSQQRPSNCFVYNFDHYDDDLDNDHDDDHDDDLHFDHDDDHEGDGHGDMIMVMTMVRS